MFTKIKTSRLLALLLIPALWYSIACCGGNETAKTFTSNDSTGGSSRDDTTLVNGRAKTSANLPSTTPTTPTIKVNPKILTRSDSTGGSSRDDTTLMKKKD
jgi:hypothetical protein